MASFMHCTHGGLSLRAGNLQIRPHAFPLQRRPTFRHQLQSPHERQSVRLQSGAFEPFDEGAAQVQRLLKRDKKELTGEEEIGAAMKTEFDDPAAAEPSTSASQSGRRQRGRTDFKSNESTSNPFGGAAKSPTGPANPFGGSNAQKPFTEPGNYYSEFEPDMGIVDVPWYKSIGLAQVVIALSFLLVIVLMIATFFFVLKVGAVRFND